MLTESRVKIHIAIEHRVQSLLHVIGDVRTFISPLRKKVLPNPRFMPSSTSASLGISLWLQFGDTLWGESST